MMEHEDKKRVPDQEFLNDVNFEPEEDLGSVGVVQAKLKKIKEELETAKKERQEYLDGWQRCKADSVNARKDALASAERSSERAKEDFLLEIIPVLDSFDMAMGNEAWNSVEEAWKNGIERIRDQLLGILERGGVRRFGKLGEQFDPTRHEVVQEVDDMPGEPHSIVKILRYGYQNGKRVVRPAQVIVKASGVGS